MPIKIWIAAIHRILRLRHWLDSSVRVPALRCCLGSLRCGARRRHLLALSWVLSMPLALSLRCSLLWVSSVAARLVYSRPKLHAIDTGRHLVTWAVLALESLNVNVRQAEAVDATLGQEWS